jgi:hypothetical protein
VAGPRLGNVTDDDWTRTEARVPEFSRRLSFHLPLLGPTGADWLDDPPDMSCKDSTCRYAVDDPLPMSGQVSDLGLFALLASSSSPSGG